jgi:hypothetical protein
MKKTATRLAIGNIVSNRVVMKAAIVSFPAPNGLGMVAPRLPGSLTCEKTNAIGTNAKTLGTKSKRYILIRCDIFIMV